MVFRRWLDGEAMRAIGASMVPKISATTVCHDIQLALKEWKDENRASIKEMADFEWQLLVWVLLECQKNYELTTNKKTRDQAGDPRFLELAIRSGEHRRKLFGLDKPAKIEAQTTSEVIVSTSFKKLEELKDLIRRKMTTLQNRKDESSQ